jgi:hypothetical protein
MGLVVLLRRLRCLIEHTTCSRTCLAVNMLMFDAAA